MPFPKVRMTINPAEALLLMPGLNTVVDGLAAAKLGAFPHLYPYHRLDPVRAAAIYKNRAFDDETAGRFLALRDKLRAIPQSGKTRIDVVDAAVAGFALRLWKAHRPSGTTGASATAVTRLKKKIERYRRRAKRAAIGKVGKVSYQETAERWRRFVAWARYTLLYFKVPGRRQPFWSIVWRNQRRELTQAFEVALRARFFEVPSDVEMVRLVTLATRSLKRSRHAVSFMDLLHAPQSHVDFLISLARKRVQLKRLPGAAVPRWESASDRADAFRAFREKMAKAALSPSSAKPPETSTKSYAPEEAAPPTATMINQLSKDQKPRTEEGLVQMTGEGLQKSIANWLYQTVTMDFAYSVCTEARSQISNQLLDQHRGPTIADLFEGLFERVMIESRPTEFSIHRPTRTRQYAGWLLHCLLALRQEPGWINHAIGVAMGRAKEMEDEDRHAECLAAISNGRA